MTQIHQAPGFKELVCDIIPTSKDEDILSKDLQGAASHHMAAVLELQLP
jgi:hypothetical protein